MSAGKWTRAGITLFAVLFTTLGVLEMEASARRANFQEVELGYARDAAKKESTRCLRCDVEL